MKVHRNTKVIIKKGSVIHSWNDKPGTRVVGKNYAVTVAEHYITKTENTIHWVGRHGEYCHTNFENVKIVSE